MLIQKRYRKFIENLEGDNNATMFFIIKDVRETILAFSQEIVKVLQNRSENLYGINTK